MIGRADIRNSIFTNPGDKNKEKTLFDVKFKGGNGRRTVENKNETLTPTIPYAPGQFANFSIVLSSVSISGFASALSLAGYVYESYTVACIIFSSNLFGNTKNVINYSPYKVTATGNYWNASTSDSIQKTIADGTDDLDYGFVNFNDWANVPFDIKI